jgi:hypothetical protein
MFMSDMYEGFDPSRPFKDAPTSVSKEQLQRIQAKRSADAEAAIQRRQADEARRGREREAARRESGAAALEAHREACLTRFLAAGGASSDWPATWRTLREQYLADAAAQDPVTRLANEMRQHPRYDF